MRRLLLSVALAAAALAGTVPAAHADLTGTGPADLRIRDGHALAEAADGSLRVWDLRRGRVGPRHHLGCGTSRLAEWGRDAGEAGSAFVAVTLERLEPQRDAAGNLVGLPPQPQQGPDDLACRPARAALDPDGDGRSEPGVVAVLHLTDLGRKVTVLPTLRLPAEQTAPSGLWVVRGDVWLAVEGGAGYVRLPAGARAWAPGVGAASRPAVVDPDSTTGVRLLRDGALWRWSWRELARRGHVRVTKGARVRLARRPRTIFTVANPKPGSRPSGVKGACASPRRVTTGGPGVAVVDDRGRGGWGISDGAIRWRCGRGRKAVDAERVDLFWLLRTTNGGRSWRLAGRHPVGAALVGLLGSSPVFEQGASACPRRLVVRRGGRLREIACKA